MPRHAIDGHVALFLQVYIQAETIAHIEGTWRTATTQHKTLVINETRNKYKNKKHGKRKTLSDD